MTVHTATQYHVTIKDSKTLQVIDNKTWDSYLGSAIEHASSIELGQLSMILVSNAGRYRLHSVYEYEAGHIVNTYKKG